MHELPGSIGPITALAPTIFTTASCSITRTHFTHSVLLRSACLNSGGTALGPWWWRCASMLRSRNLSAAALRSLLRIGRGSLGSLTEGGPMGLLLMFKQPMSTVSLFESFR